MCVGRKWECAGLGRRERSGRWLLLSAGCEPTGRGKCHDAEVGQEEGGRQRGLRIKIGESAAQKKRVWPERFPRHKDYTFSSLPRGEERAKKKIEHGCRNKKNSGQTRVVGGPCLVEDHLGESFMSKRKERRESAEDRGPRSSNHGRSQKVLIQKKGPRDCKGRKQGEGRTTRRWEGWNRF